MNLSRYLAVAFLLGVALTVAADVAIKLTGQAKGELWGSETIGYWAAMGLLWSLIALAVSRVLGRYWLGRGEGHYGEDNDVGAGDE